MNEKEFIWRLLNNGRESVNVDLIKTGQSKQLPGKGEESPL